jgi:hypothetical protein
MARAFPSAIGGVSWSTLNQIRPKNLAGAIVLILSGLITLAWIGFIGAMIVHVLQVAVSCSAS